MAQNADNVQIGPSRIFLGVTNPASGTPPTWMTHTAGVPTPGTEVGFTTGDTIFRKTRETADQSAEQSLGPIFSYLTGETVEIEFTALERVYNTLAAALDNTSGQVNDGSRMGFFGGGSQYALRTQTVFLSAPRAFVPGKYEVAVIYRAVNVTGFETAYRKGGASEYKITLRGQYDPARVIGDQLYQYQIEK